MCLYLNYLFLIFIFINFSCVWRRFLILVRCVFNKLLILINWRILKCLFLLLLFNNCVSWRFFLFGCFLWWRPSYWKSSSANCIVVTTDIVVIASKDILLNLNLIIKWVWFPNIHWLSSDIVNCIFHSVMIFHKVIK
jgi:hypothetical protein